MRTQTELQRLAMAAHQEARQRVDLRRDLALKLQPSAGPFIVGESIWFHDRDQSKIRGGLWIPARVVGVNAPPMLTIHVKGVTRTVNQSKVRKNPDPWHDVVITMSRGSRGAVPSAPRPKAKAKASPKFALRRTDPVVKKRPAASASPAPIGDASSDFDFSPPGTPRVQNIDSDAPFDDLDDEMFMPDDPFLMNGSRVCRQSQTSPYSGTRCMATPMRASDIRFLQFYQESDILSAVVSSYTDCVGPATQTSLHLKSLTEQKNAFDKYKPIVTWFGLHSSAPISEEVQSFIVYMIQETRKERSVLLPCHPAQLIFLEDRSV